MSFKTKENRMAKRMTDTDKWKKPFIKSLPIEYKMFWLYLLDDCDHAGLWHTDFEVAELRLGIKLSQKKAEGLFEEKVVLLDNGTKWFIPDFITFQYGDLNPSNRAHQSVLNILNRYGLTKYLKENKGHLSPLQGAKDKEQEKDMDKDLWTDVQNSFFNDFRWKEKFCRDKSVSMFTLEEKMKVFISDLELKEDLKDLKELKNHFTNWFNKNGKSTTDKGAERLNAMHDYINR